ncbi:hypothetical protein Tco_0691732 [Tanacetum coccineum]
MNTTLNQNEKLDENIVQKHGGSKQVGFKQLGPGVETGVHGVHDEKRVWFEVALQGAQGDREAEVYTTMYEECGRQTFGCCRDTTAEWAEDTTRSTYLVNRSQSSAIGFKKPIDMLGFFGWLVSIKQGMLEPVKVKCIFLGYHKSLVGNKLWRLNDVTSKVVLYRNMSFNESGEYKKTFIGSGVGTVSMQMLHGFEFEVEPLEDHTFELARDRDQHLACELFEYREDSNETAFAVATVENIYAHESLTFNNTVACEVISKWKAGLKDDMDARSDVDQSGNTLRVSQSKFYNRKLVQTLLEGHSILSLEGSLSEVCDVEKNGKWSCIYAVGSQEYQMVCTRLDIASADVGMLDKFDRGLQTNVQVFVDFDYAMGRSITVMGR